MLYTREGGSGPQADARRRSSRRPWCSSASGLPDDRIHAPNEKADIEFLLARRRGGGLPLDRPRRRPGTADAVPDPGLLRSLALARGDLDRAAERREDAAWLDAAWADPATRVVLVHRGRTLVDGRRPTRAARRRRRRSRSCAAAEAAYDGVRVLLAVDGGTTYVALLVDAAVEPWDAPDGTAVGGPARGRRGARRPRRRAARDGRGAGQLARDATRAARAAACRPCRRRRAGRAPARTTRRQHFPRRDPAVIVLVRDDDDRALLGRRADWPDGFFSTLAGFVEAGESAEMAVLREMAEEAGVAASTGSTTSARSRGRSRRASCSATTRGSRPARRRRDPDGDEITEVRWFTREEMLAGVRGRHACASRRAVSIARRLVEHWYGAELPGAWSRPSMYSAVRLVTGG